MPILQEVDLTPLPPERFESVLTADQYERFRLAIADARRRFDGVTVWNVNSTQYGGGVAEMLPSLLGYVLGAGLRARWLVVPGVPDFFRVTKRIHNLLHGSPGDGGALDDEARLTYESALRTAADELRRRIRPGDCVVVHDPQPAGLVPAMRDAGAHTIWRCHVGVDVPNEHVRRAWSFLLPYVRPAEAYVFSRSAFVWEGLDPQRVAVIPPSLDAFSTKNVALSTQEVSAILSVADVLPAPGVDGARFTRSDGTSVPIVHRADMVEVGPAPPDARIVTQVGRWDRLKDPVGVIEGFAGAVASRTDAHLVMAGPSVAAVADDPEGAQVLRECVEAWERLAAPVKARVHLACLPMLDAQENAAIVNALQRRADVVVQKSVAEGFGLTVAEAMWKARPVVASRVGGIQDQIEDGRTGLLVDDPRDLTAFGSLVAGLLEDAERSAAIGRAAQESVRDHFLGPLNLMRYAKVLTDLVQTR